MLNYEGRIKIPLVGDNDTCFFTKSGLLIAKGYDRVVIGGRGPYIEFSYDHLVKKHMVPATESHYYYLEYRTIDVNNVKIYYQLHTVDYADYIVTSFYISPFDLIVNDKPVIESIKDSTNKEQKSLMDYLPS